MLKFWDQQEVLVEVPGASQPAAYVVYGDDVQADLYYVVPQPTIRINDEDRLAFAFLKYRRAPSDAPAGAEAGGAYLILDTELDVPDYASRQIRDQLGARFGNVRLGRIPYTSGTVRLVVPTGNDQLVRAIESLGNPSLTGKNTASFAAQLSREAATLYEQALSAPAGGAVQVAYAMKTWARSGNTTVTLRYNANQTRTVLQTAFKDSGAYSPGVIWRVGQLTETMRDELVRKNAAQIDFRWGDRIGEKAQEQIRTWAWGIVTKLVNEQLASLAAPGGEQRKSIGEGYTHHSLEMSARTDINQVFSENFAFELDLIHQGMLPSVGSMVSRGGTRYRWEDYARPVDLDDPFFKRLAVRVATNVAFELPSQPITRVEVDLSYPADGDQVTRTLAFTRAAAAPQVWLDAPYLVPGADGALDREYRYCYRIFYEGLDRPFESEPATARRTELAVAGNTERVFAVDAKATGIAFGTASDDVREVTVLVALLDAGDRPEDDRHALTLTAAQPSASLRRPLGPAAAPPYRYVYTAVYTFGDGRTITVDGRPRTEVELPVPGPYPDFRAVTIDPRLDEGDTATVHLHYVEPGLGDPARIYSRTAQFQVDRRNSRSWTFGVFARARGTLTWSSTLYFKDGTTEEVAPQVLRWDQGTITVRRGTGEAGELFVDVSPFALEGRWRDDLRRVEVDLLYEVPEQNVRQTGRLRFACGADGMPPVDQRWKVPVRGGCRDYRARFTYRLMRGDRPTTVVSAWQTSSEPSLDIPCPEDVIPS